MRQLVYIGFGTMLAAAAVLGFGIARTHAAPLSLDPVDYRQHVVPSQPALKSPQYIVIMQNEFRLYLVREDGTMLHWGIGIGRRGFELAGTKTVISTKKEWPSWTPPVEMIARQPDLPRYVAGGPGNPLGARALYLGSSLYRIHGTSEPWTIGKRVSSGCIRMRNEDVVELYNLVQPGTVVLIYN